MSDEIGTNFNKLMLMPDFLVPTDSVVRGVALVLFHRNDYIPYANFSHYATKEQYNQAVAFVFG